MAIPLKDIVSFHQSMQSEDLVLVYEGEFNQEVTKSVLAMTERNFDSEGLDSGVKKKAYNIMVEVLQNICKHQFVDSEIQKNAIFLVGENEEDVFITSGNLIKNHAIAALTEKINLINSKDKEGLKELFKQLRLNSTISDVGGAGLGFVDMARKSENKIEFQFDEINADVSYFILLCRITKTTN